MSLNKNISPDTYKYLFDKDIYVLSETSEQASPPEVSTPQVDTSEVKTSNAVDKNQVTPTPRNWKDLIVVTNTDLSQLNESTRAFFTKVLQAIHKSHETLDNVNGTELKSTAFADLLQQKVKLILIVDINPFELGIQNTVINKYELTTYQQVPVLYIDEFSKIEQDVNLKKALWLNLKKAFGV